MDTRAPEYTIEDYCAMIDRKEVRVNREYQRSDEVWPRAAQSFLIETVLLDFPVPKLFLHQKTDLRTQRTVKEIVDGQQRTKAFYDYLHDEFSLTSNVTLPDAVGRKCSELPQELRDKFRDYGLHFDLFVGATDEEVREVFRRMNSFTVPLNPEEQRHAEFQGEFKWFMRRLSSDYSEAFRRVGVFSQKSLVRMQDQKLLTEICSAFWDGIRTTNKLTLTRVYRTHDKAADFTGEAQAELDRRLRAALDQFFAWEDLVGTPIMKPHQVYSLVLATMHLLDPVPAMRATYEPRPWTSADRVVVNLSRLAEALEAGDDAARDFEPFLKASAEKTNVGAQRATRFVWFCRAMTDDLPA